MNPSLVISAPARELFRERNTSRPSLGPSSTELPYDLAPASAGIAALTPSGEVNHIGKRKNRKPALGSGEGHTYASLSARGKVACRATGKTKTQHRDCFPGGGTFQNYPSAPHWVDPDPCPAIALSYQRTLKKRQREEAPKGGRNVKNQDSCARVDQLRRKAQRIVKLLEVEQSLKAVKPLPSDFVCGSLRAKVRSMYADELTLVQQLSIKTAALAESQPCPYCENLQLSDKMEKYEKARYQTVEVDAEHLDFFGRMFAENVPTGWNKKSDLFPYVPNGAGSLDNPRREGGNWNESSFSTECRATHVFTKGKWRTVTMYSSRNVEVLTPLHNSLYSYLKRRSWLLVGNPTGEKLDHLQSGCCGKDWLSFDYEAATDNIKAKYVQKMVEILIEKGEGLDDEQVSCLRVLGALDLGSGVAEVGQPMGSPMSFPLLCLINKTVVDMALTRLLTQGKISFKEWTSHRCLINGDDLLTKDDSSSGLAEAIFREGRACGLRSNWEKTLRSAEIGEINSTCFENCVWQKKTNVSALWMAAEVTDVLGFAREATTSKRGFMMVVKNNVSRLARQKIKTSVKLPFELREMLLACRKTKKALCSKPASSAPKETNLFPVVPVPDGYSLTLEERAAVTRQRVRAIRERREYVPIPAEKKKNSKLRKAIGVICEERRPRRGLMKTLRPNKPSDEDSVLLIFASAWEKKRKEELLAAEGVDVVNCIISDLSRIDAFVDEIKTFKEKHQRGPKAQRPSGCPFSEGIGFVSFADG